MPKSTHKLTPWIKRGQMPSIRGKQRVQKLLDELQAGLIDQLGGETRITPQQRMLLHTTIKAFGIVLLTELFVNQHGPFRPDMERRGILQYHPILEKTYLSWWNLVRLNLEKLFPNGMGIQEVTKTMDKIGDYFDESGNAKENGQ